MIDRQACGLLPDKLHTALRVPERPGAAGSGAPDGALLYEEMFTRGGFDGPFTAFYHLFALPSQREPAASCRGPAATHADPDAARPLKRRLYDSGRLPSGGMLVDRRVPILFNDDVAVLLARPDTTDDVYFANGDGDELWFVQEGSGRVESPCGWLRVESGDYVWVPRSMIHRWHVDAPMRLFGFEARGGVGIPEAYRNAVGQIRMDAPYGHRDFVRPAGPIASPGQPLEGPRELLVKKGGAVSRYALASPAMDVVGWEGTVYPVALAISKFQPKTSTVHLPPTVHATFSGRGFLVCSFVPRLVDYDPRAIPCPYPHSSVDCDEVILYLRGHFTSRRGALSSGAISLHPAGIAHGPHPGAYEASIGATRTDELAVMCDTFSPLVPTPQAANIEDAGYHESWR
ncbi:MAG TPA: homogentisate 1,2-dioxygenase domain-containing protein [Polyangiaceae bacterium]|nr:homogentisate 1,2-dioxygenase domain-containing protein [Polyangiaceae bacterium]